MPQEETPAVTSTAGQFSPVAATLLNGPSLDVYINAAIKLGNLTADEWQALPEEERKARRADAKRRTYLQFYMTNARPVLLSSQQIAEQVEELGQAMSAAAQMYHEFKDRQ